MNTRKPAEQRSRVLIRQHYRRQRRKEDADARDVMLRERDQTARLNAKGTRPSKLIRELAELRRAYARLCAQIERRPSRPSHGV
jgi:hypothetical protein